MCLEFMGVTCKDKQSVCFLVCHSYCHCCSSVSSIRLLRVIARTVHPPSGERLDSGMKTVFAVCLMQIQEGQQDRTTIVILEFFCVLFSQKRIELVIRTDCLFHTDVPSLFQTSGPNSRLFKFDAQVQYIFDWKCSHNVILSML